METLKTYLKFWQEACDGSTCKPDILDLEIKLLTMGFSPLRIGGNDRPIETLAIEMPNGHPLFINFRGNHNDVKKGYIHFFVTMPENANYRFITKAEEKSESVAPTNCTIRTLSAKKVQAWIGHFNPILSEALTEFYAGRALVAEWRESVKNSGFSVYESSVKSNNADNLNVEVTSPCKDFRVVLGAQSQYKYCSQSLAFIGSGSWDKFLQLCALGEVKSWHAVDFAGLNYMHSGFLVFGSSRAVKLWCVENEKILGAIGFIVRDCEMGEGAIMGASKRALVAL